jgi:thiol-disulfide isomerase/thioredoxin
VGVVACAIAQARQRGGAEPPAASGTRAGLAVVGVAVALLAVHTGWVITHLDWLRPMRAGDPVPAFALPRIGPRGALGAPVRSADLADTVVVLDFWAPWCGPCVRAMPALSALAARHPGGELVVLSIDLEDFEGGRALFDAEGYAQVLVADAGGASERFGVHEIPHLVVVDHGVVRLVARGDGSLRRTITLAEELTREHAH